MTDLSNNPAPSQPPIDTVERAAWLDAVRARTPARLFVGRSGPAYSTATQLALRQDHAAAVDAVYAELDLERDLTSKLAGDFGLFCVQTQAVDKTEYLLRPDLGRRLGESAQPVISEKC